MIHLASALGRPIGSLNSWASVSMGLLPKRDHNGDVVACVATAKWLHATRNANREPAVIKKNGREYKSASALASEVGCEHGLALAEARKRIKREETDYPASFTVNSLTYTDAAGFRQWAARHGYEPLTLETLPVVWPDAEPTPELPMECAPADAPEQADADLVRDAVNDLLEIVARLETRFVPRGPGQ